MLVKPPQEHNKIAVNGIKKNFFMMLYWFNEFNRSILMLDWSGFSLNKSVVCSNTKSKLVKI